MLGLIHSQPDARSLHCELQRRGVTDLLWNRAEQRTSPVFLPEYTRRDHLAALERLEGMLAEGGERLFQRGGVEAYRLRPRACDAGPEPGSPDPR